MPRSNNESVPHCLSWLQKGGGGDKRRKQVFRSSGGTDLNDPTHPSIVATLGYHPRSLHEPLSPRGNPDRVLGFKTFSLESPAVAPTVPEPTPLDEIGSEKKLPAVQPQVQPAVKSRPVPRLHFGPPLPSSVQPSPRAFRERAKQSPRTRAFDNSEHSTSSAANAAGTPRSPLARADSAVEEFFQDVPMEEVQPAPREQPTSEGIKAKMAMFQTMMSAASAIQEHQEEPGVKEGEEADAVQRRSAAKIEAEIEALKSEAGPSPPRIPLPAAQDQVRIAERSPAVSEQQSPTGFHIDLQMFDSTDDESGSPFPEEPEQMPIQKPRTEPNYAAQPNPRWSADHNSSAWVSDLLQDDPTVVVTYPSRNGPSAEDVRLTCGFFSNDVALRQAKPEPLDTSGVDGQRLRLSAANLRQPLAPVPCFRYRSGSAFPVPAQKAPEHAMGVAPDQAISAAPTPQHMSEKSNNSVPSLPSCFGTPRDQPAVPATYDGAKPGAGAGAGGGALLTQTSVFRVSEMQTESAYIAGGSLMQRIELDLQMLDSASSSARSSPRDFADRRIGLLC